MSAGIAYPDTGRGGRPVVAFGEPVDLVPLADETPGALTRSIQRDLQGAVDEAWRISTPR